MNGATSDDLGFDALYQRGMEQEFVARVEHLAADMGYEVYQSVLKVLCDLSIDTDEARTIWQSIVLHWQQLKYKGWDVSLITAMSDYLYQHTDYLQQPKLTEIDHYERLLRESSCDPLTGILNKRHMMESLKQLVSLTKRNEGVLSIMFLDIDNFKVINDTHGHMVGDMALKAYAEIIDREKRDSDLAARFGGEEFVIIMPDTNCNDALILGERIRSTIAECKIPVGDAYVQTTISGGIAAYPIHADSIDELIYNADSAVYRAKGAGKNLICLFKEESRRYLRVSIQEEVQVKVLGITMPGSGKGKAIDIGVGGILFQSDTEFPIGWYIQVNVLFKDQPLILIGTVVRVELISPGCYDIGVSLAFEEMERFAKRRITGLLSDKRKSMS